MLWAYAALGMQPSRGASLRTSRLNLRTTQRPAATLYNGIIAEMKARTGEFHVTMLANAAWAALVRCAAGCTAN